MREDWLFETPAGVFNEAFVWLSSGLASNYQLLYQWDLALLLSVALVFYLSSALQRVDILGARSTATSRE
uniref:Uncharacterized protein n=1 Tax=Ditylenchus dipsaci TaxID=166011 RepID=A0A915EJW2_9BILA